MNVSTTSASAQRTGFRDHTGFWIARPSPTGAREHARKWLAALPARQDGCVSGSEITLNETDIVRAHN